MPNILENIASISNETSKFDSTLVVAVSKTKPNEAIMEAYEEEDN